MSKILIHHIQDKINALKHELKAIKYTISVDGIESECDKARINECANKIQVLNEIIISFGVQNNNKK